MSGWTQLRTRSTSTVAFWSGTSWLSSILSNRRMILTMIGWKDSCDATILMRKAEFTTLPEAAQLPILELSSTTSSSSPRKLLPQKNLLHSSEAVSSMLAKLTWRLHYCFRLCDVYNYNRIRHLRRWTLLILLVPQCGEARNSYFSFILRFRSSPRDDTLNLKGCAQFLMFLMRYEIGHSYYINTEGVFFTCSLLSVLYNVRLFPFSKVITLRSSSLILHSQVFAGYKLFAICRSLTSCMSTQSLRISSISEAFVH